MNDTQRELTSALLDGELNREGQLRMVSGLLESGREGLDRFGRYRLIGDVMRGESAVLATSLAQRVRASLADEPVVLAPRRQPPRWLRPVAGLAVAASVATAAVVVAPQLIAPQGDGPPPAQTVAALPPPAVAPTLVATGPAARSGQADSGPQWKTLDRELEDRLNRLVIEHNEFSGRTGINGPVPHLGFVSYEAR